MSAGFSGKAQLQNCPAENMFFLFLLGFFGGGVGGASVLASRLGPSALFFNSHPAINSEF
jgi:hypothetical protein